MARHSMLSLVAVVALVVAVSAQRSADWTWRTGRATHYGGPSDGWSIMKGSCQYYYLDRFVGTGWDVCAPADQNWDFDGGSCGVCYEVACDARKFSDGYGQTLDRSGVCHDSSSSIVVMVTDSCPCNYPANQYSNKRWCCGDNYHLDLSVYAFEKLAETRWGVIGIKYRRVPCNTQPAKIATIPSWVTPTPPEGPAPWGWDSSMDKRPSIGTTYASATAVATSDGASASSNAWASASSPSEGSSASAVATAAASASSGASSGSGYIFANGLQQGWGDYSYSASRWDSSNSKGSDGSLAYCTTVSPGGGVTFAGWKGAFSGRRVLDMLVKKNDYGVPDFYIQILNNQGTCQQIRMPQVSWVQSVGSDWMRFSVPLNAFSWSPDWSPNAAEFKGCNGANLGALDITTVQFKNARGNNQWICLSNVRLA